MELHAVTRTHSKIALVMFALSVAADVTAAQSSLQAIERTFRSDLMASHAPGGALTIVAGERVVLSSVFGVTRVDGGRPISPDTPFVIASTTKSFTAAALLTELHEKHINLDAPISSFTDGLPLAVRRLTPAQILSNTAGLMDDPIANLTPEHSSIQADVLAWPPEVVFVDPGQIYSYSNPGFSLAGAILERLSRKSYADELQDLIFAPAGMNHSTARQSEARSPVRAQGHFVDPQGRVTALPTSLDDWGARAPAGGVFATAHDLGRYMIMLLNNGQIDGKHVISPEVLTSMWTPHAQVPGIAYGYGFGWEAPPSANGIRIAEADGGAPGFVCVLLVVPERRLGITILANIGYANFRRTTTQALSQLGSVRLEEPEHDPAPTAPSADDVRQLLGKYSLGPGKQAEIVLKDGRPLLHYGPVETPLLKLGPNRFRADPWILTVLKGNDGSVRYLFAEGRVAKRLN